MKRMILAGSAIGMAALVATPTVASADTTSPSSTISAKACTGFSVSKPYKAWSKPKKKWEIRAKVKGSKCAGWIYWADLQVKNGSNWKTIDSTEKHGSLDGTLHAIASKGTKTYRARIWGQNAVYWQLKQQSKKIYVKNPSKK